MSPPPYAGHQLTLLHTCTMCTTPPAAYARLAGACTKRTVQPVLVSKPHSAAPGVYQDFLSPPAICRSPANPTAHMHHLHQNPPAAYARRLASGAKACMHQTHRLQPRASLVLLHPDSVALFWSAELDLTLVTFKHHAKCINTHLTHDWYSISSSLVGIEKRHAEEED